MQKNNSCMYKILLVKNNIANIIYDVDFFQIKNLFLSDTKKNIIMDGKFTKIMYSDDLITTHGIFLKIPFQTSLVRDHASQRSQQLTTSSTFGSDSSLDNIGQNSQSLITKSTGRKPEDFGQSSDTIYRGRPTDELNPISQKNYGVLYNENSDKLTNDNLFSSNTKYKQIYKLQSHNILNSKNITDIIRIEMQILEFYKQLFQCKKKTIFMLKEQLQDGNIKLYRDSFNNYIDFPSNNNNSYSPIVLLKISGIWENDENIGLTYKFIEFTKTSPF
jgi:hypothetical protein